MISIFVGQLTGIDDGTEGMGSIRGNGKDIAQNFYLLSDYEEGRYIFTNYETDFSIVMPAQQIIQEINLNPDKYRKKGVSVGLTELSTVLNSLGSPASVVKFVSFWVQQTRKTKCDVYGNLQRFKDLHPRFRNAPDYVLRPVKYHEDLEICWLDDCPEKEHYIKVFSLKPSYPFPDCPITGDEIIVCSEVGKHYNTDELVFDEIVLPKKSKKG